MTSSVFSIENLCVSRGNRRVLHNASLEVRSGEIVALLGANGAGKSTLVMSGAGAFKIDEGSVSLDELPLKGLTPDRIRRQGVSVVPEGHQVLRDLSVEDNLLAAGTSLSAQALAQSVDEALTLFPELKARLTTQAGNLSGGQKQMVSISQALISRPKFLLIDELSLGLAPTVVQRLVEALKLISSRGVGILLVEQFTQLALAVSSRAYVLQLGKIVFKGESATLLDHPSLLHDAYLGS